MYSEEDINGAVAAGALTPDAAAALRAHMTRVREVPRTDEENFRLVNSFNDIFVAIAIIIMLVAAGATGQAIGGLIAPAADWPTGQVADAVYNRIAQQNAYNTSMSLMLGAALVAATAWPLAEIFARRRRMALPSILLLLAFVGGTLATLFGLGQLLVSQESDMAGALILAGAGLFAAGAAWLHWRRFMVPITIAAGAGALALTVLALIVSGLEAAGVEDSGTIILWLVFITGLLIFAFAMRWDISDRERVTRRSDVAFWLHLLAAPMIAHPVFHSLGIMSGGDAVGIGSALAVLGIYVVFGIVALVIDRRALLVSALAYVLAALTFLFDRFGAVELNFALTALVIGSALLTLSAFWTPLRARLVAALPTAWQARVPVSGVAPPMGMVPA